MSSSRSVFQSLVESPFPIPSCPIIPLLHQSRMSRWVKMSQDESRHPFPNSWGLANLPDLVAPGELDRAWLLVTAGSLDLTPGKCTMVFGETFSNQNCAQFHDLSCIVPPKRPATIPHCSTLFHHVPPVRSNVVDVESPPCGDDIGRKCPPHIAGRTIWNFHSWSACDTSCAQHRAAVKGLRDVPSSQSSNLKQAMRDLNAAPHWISCWNSMKQL